MLFKIDGNVSVRIEAAGLDYVYGGMLEGMPTKKQNEDYINGLKEKNKKSWGERRTYVVQPETTCSDNVKSMLARLPNSIKSRYEKEGGVEYLPKYSWSVWLTSFDTKDKKNYDGTELVLIFFADSEAIHKDIISLVKAASTEFNWFDVAQNFGV